MRKSRFKSVVVLSVVFCAVLAMGVNNALAYSGEISIAKNSLATLDEYAQLKSFAPAKYQAFIDSCINSVNQGRDSYYKVSMRLEDSDSQGIAAVTITNPNAKTFQCVKDASGKYVSFSLPTAVENQGYFTLADLQADFPSGPYTIVITLTNKTTITETATLPSYNAGSFPDFVTGNLEANPSNVMQLTWSSVDSDGVYDVWAQNLDKDTTVFETPNLSVGYPDSTVTTLSGAIAGKNDYEIGVEAKNTVSTSSLSFVLKSEQSWFAFKASFDLITLCTVKAGKSSTLPDDSILMAGQLTATGTDLSGASEIKVTISSVDVPSLYVQSFPVTGVTLKNGKYSGSAGTSKFTFDSTTHKFSIVANNVNLTGLWCPFTVKFEIGTFNTEVTVDEYVANGPLKSLPIQLMVGVRNVMNVDSFKVKYGKTTGSDSFTIKGVFAVKGSYNKSQPFSLHLGTEQFTVAGSTFTTSGSVEYTQANSAEGPTVVASFDFAKCTFTIEVTNANIKDYGLVDLDMGVLGINLSNPTQLDLGAQRVFGLEDILGYDTLGASWTYDSDYSYSIAMPGDKHSDSGTTTAKVQVSNTKKTFNGTSCYEVGVSNPSGSPYYTYWYPDADNQIWAGMTMGSSSSKFGYVINTAAALPLEPAMGRVYSDSKPFTGDIHLDLSVYGLTFTMTSFMGTATQSLKSVGYEDVSIPYGAGDYRAIKGLYTRNLKGTYHYSSFDHSSGKTTGGQGTFTGTETQTMWSVPGLGVVQINSKMSVTISAMGYSIVIKVDEFNALKGHS